MPVYFIQSESVQNNRIILTGDLAHHLRDVLRFEAGDTIELVDEKQGRYRTELTLVTKQKIVANILQKVEKPIPSEPSIFLAQAVLKSDKMDWVIQKATELGVNTILPVVTERTIARPRVEREAHQIDRWQKIAKEASQQCGRSDIPAVRTMVSLDALLKNPPDVSLKLVPWEREQEPSLKAVLQNLEDENSVMILIGPEGGFAASEVEKARNAGWISVSLGPRILRAETAGLAVLAILQYELETRR
ncbi:MAG TPA: 16S rRNA (uracil(1498)-N(3))-methyltransferase [Nitrospiria bacterium]|nr:16S rRNA (uracil(1498)-N(3))-methyltransferase [Nitrospiria bacterium]